MRPITFDRHTYYRDGKPAFLYSGEFHYFRVPRADWRRRMELFKAAGGNCLATYIPWLIHEPVEGRFCFEGPRHDLEAFFALAAEVGLAVIARPGPYQYSELLNAGLPSWLVEGYRQVLATDPRGEILHPMAVSYVHPLFLEKAHAWFAEVCPRIARWTVSCGGPVAFTQLDNELIGIHVWFGGLDYNEDAMGFGQATGRYPRFLMRKYREIAQLNARYGTAFTDFAAVTPLPPPGAGTPEDVRRLKDYFEFELANTADYGVTLAGWLREHGIDTPLVHNAANPGMNAWFRELCDAMGEDFILGSDHYYTLGQNWAQNNPTPQYAVRMFVSLEMLRLLGYPPTVYEMPGGSPSDWPPFTAHDAKACYLTNVALGAKGINYYIYTGGPNLSGTGTTADIYDYSAAVAADGTVRPLYAVQKALGQFLKKRPWLADAERLADCRVALNLDDARADGYWSGHPVPCSPLETAKFLHTGVLSTAFCAGLSPELVRLDAGDWPADLATPLVVPSGSVMRATDQQRLVDYLAAGGKALFTPVLPTHDEELLPCTLLADYLGATAAVPAPKGAPARLCLAGIENVGNTGEVFFSDSLPVGAEVCGTEAYSGRTVAWRRDLPGGGAAVMLGFRWMHAMREHEAMLTNLLAALGLRRRLCTDNPNVWVTLWQGGGHAALFLMNLLSAAQTVSVAVARPDGSTRSLGTHRLAAMTVKVVEFTPDADRP